MHSGIHVRVADGAVMEHGGPTSRAETQMPTWQQQHAGLSFPAPPAHPPHAGAVFRRRRRGSPHFLFLLHVIAAAAGLGVSLHRTAADEAAGDLLVADVGQDLFQVGPERIGGGFVEHHLRKKMGFERSSEGEKQ
nr:hypothetical protein Iba_scaffold3316CG0270 [Ipomoea batatas]